MLNEKSVDLAKMTGGGKQISDIKMGMKAKGQAMHRGSSSHGNGQASFGSVKMS